MGKTRWGGRIGLCVLAAACGSAQAPADAPRAHAAAARGGCTGDNGGLVLPPGFCATVFADGLGHVRHLAVDAAGRVYANSQGGAEGGGPAGLILLRDADRDGHAEAIEHIVQAPTGGTGLALHDGYVYLEDGDAIRRIRLDPAAGRATGAAETVVRGLPTTGDHHSHSIAITRAGALFVNSGSATNACQRDNRQPGSPGLTPCAELATRAGIWRFDAAGHDQPFAPAARYATGIRNAVGLALDGRDRLFATQHGRDQLHENWPRLYTAVQGQELPAEELVAVGPGSDFGWPRCYYDPGQKKLVLAPEYGGDGGHAVGACATKVAPIASFPAHWAPNALLLYGGTQFPQAYRGGAFIAFHGSWNRAPGPQGGFNIVFQPLRDGRASGAAIVFADGFAGADKASGGAAHRPSGLAMAPDGSLYVGDDKAGRIWRIHYSGPADAALTGVAVAAPGPVRAPAASAAAASAPVPPGATAAMVALGRRIYAGAVADGTCAGCHGPGGEGSAVAPRLSDGQWLWGDGSPAAIRRVIVAGVPHPKKYPAPMPPYGGATLTPAQTDAVAAYIWSIAHGGR
ncbi:c-type cytochrome [Sphingomonas morindae]|uniref:PQQ-dependent sugar dehydrogenase n=1 Tax=Sphingomonas morindae TaxID=1541170 RepID=A0ABY4XDI2_9SPHN|nr:c-type cytochrome [Sphingomonas morindae]USI75032.1 PQQ-dependent sugar dehydrogenase [Sphingomonas morindae]